MNITPEQLEQHKNSLKLTTAEIDLHEKELECWKLRGRAERNLFAWIADVSADPGVSRVPLKAYTEAHKAHYEAQGNLKELVIVKLKSQHAMLTAFIAEAERMIKEPDRKLVDLQ
jgi:hypothetical protein